MRALRDFNIPKIVADDLPVFMGLIGDLFPALDVPRKRDMDFEKMIRQATLDQKLQPEDNFILKVSEVIEIKYVYFILKTILFAFLQNNPPPIIALSCDIEASKMIFFFIQGVHFNEASNSGTL